MTDLPDTKPRRASFLPHDGEELQGQAPPDAYTRRVACENADRAIHQLMLDQKREAKRQTLPPIAPPACSGPDAAPHSGAEDAGQRSQDLQDGHFQADPPQQAGRAGLGRFKRIRPTRRQIILVAMGACAIWRPMLLLGIVVGAVILLAIAYLIAGPDRFANLARKRWKRFANRRPKSAARLRQFADRLALRWDQVLDRLPERWADRLALPDFVNTVDTQVNLDDAPDPFDRLAARSHQG